MTVGCVAAAQAVVGGPVHMIHMRVLRPLAH